MPTSVPFSLDDDFLTPDSRGVTPRQRWWLVLAGGILGAVIGPTGMLLQMRLSTYRATGKDLVPFPGSLSRWAGHLEALGSTGVGRTFAICGFVATLALTPRLIDWLESRLDRPSGSYYSSAAFGGVLLGTVATFLVGWMLAVVALLVGLATGTGNVGAGMTIASALGGLFVFGPLVGLFAPFFFVLPIVVMGVIFGVGYGVAVRRLAR